MYRISLTALIAVNTGLLLFVPAREHAPAPAVGSTALVAVQPKTSAPDTSSPGESGPAIATRDAATPDPAPQESAAGGEPSEAGSSEFRGASPSPPIVETADLAALILLNPLSSKASIGFLVDGEECWLAPGENQEFAGAERREIVFHRGGDFGDARRVLEGGLHRFTATPEGWELIPAADAE